MVQPKRGKDPGTNPGRELPDRSDDLQRYLGGHGAAPRRGARSRGRGPPLQERSRACRGYGHSYPGGGSASPTASRRPVRGDDRRPEASGPGQPRRQSTETCAAGGYQRAGLPTPWVGGPGADRLREPMPAHMPPILSALAAQGTAATRRARPAFASPPHAPKSARPGRVTTDPRRGPRGIAAPF